MRLSSSAVGRVGGWCSVVQGPGEPTTAVHLELAAGLLLEAAPGFG